MTVLFFITRLLTFFGAAVRCFWEYLVCRMFGIPVEDIRCFKRTELCSHVEHELTQRKGVCVMFCLFPLLMNFILGFGYILYSSYMLFYAGVKTQIIAYVMFVIGISLWTNIFPSFEDALSLKSSIYEGKSNIIVKILLAPLTAISYAGALLEKYSITFITSIAAGIVFPYVFSGAFGIVTVLKQYLF